MTTFPEPRPQEDQHFLINEKVLKFVLKTAHLQKEDIILEIGAGTGNLTKLLAPKVKKVMAVEKEGRFLEELKKIPQAEILHQDINELFQQRKYFPKIVANIPYQICEPLFRYLCFNKELKLAILLLPKPFAEKVKEHPFFSAFLEIKILQEVLPESFDPPPHVLSVIVQVNQNKKNSKNLFFRRKLFLQEDKKLKNALRDALIDYYKGKKKKILTKKQALEKIEKINISKSLLETEIYQLSNQEIWEVVKEIEEVI